MTTAFPLEIFYDGACIVCSAEIDVYRKQNPDNRLRFIDISRSDFQAQSYGKSQQDFMTKMHVRDASGTFATGVDAFLLIWEAYPKGSIYHFGRIVFGLPGINLLVRGGYALFARYRHLLPKKKAQDCDSGICDIKHKR